MTTKHAGIPVFLGGRTLVVPPLNFRGLELMQDRLNAFSGGVDKNSTDTILDAAFHALRRNYPDITRDELMDDLDVSNMQDVMEAVMDVSGLKRKQLAADAAASTDPLTGPNSTPI